MANSCTKQYEKQSDPCGCFKVCIRMLGRWRQEANVKYARGSTHLLGLYDPRGPTPIRAIGREVLLQKVQYVCSHFVLICVYILYISELRTVSESKE